MPHTIVSTQCHTQLWAHNAAHNCECRMLHTIVSAECRTLLWAQNAAELSELPRRKWNYFDTSTNSSQFFSVFSDSPCCKHLFATRSTTTIHTTLVLFASGKCWLSLFSFIYRNCVSWAPFYLPMYHQLKISLLFTVCSPSLWAVQWWSSCADYCPGDFQTHLLVFSTLVGNSRPRLKSV